MKNEKSIFEEYYSLPQKIKDKLLTNGENGIDVIIPLINTNELWERNLFNFFERIPINRLIIGDGGCTDGSISIARKFPRVVVLDQKGQNSQGYAIKQLIENVESEWFIYLHADVFLPEGWYESMCKYKGEYDWFECSQRHSILLEHTPYDYSKIERAYSGSQMGLKKAFDGVTNKIDDDFLQRNEDIIFAELVVENGFKYGINEDVFHYHQLMNKRGDMEPQFDNIYLKRKSDEEWEKKIWNKQARGIIKYLQPNKKYLVIEVNLSLRNLSDLHALDWKEFRLWVKETNPIWLKHINKNMTLRQKIVALIKLILKY